MSTTQRGQNQCSYCGETFSIGYNRDFCTEACKDREQGRKLLNTLYNPHTYCSLCGSKLKDVEPPKPTEAFDTTGGGWGYDDEGNVTFTAYQQEESRKAAIGFEYLTDKADTGLKTAYQADNFERKTHGVVCGECGNASLFDPQEDIRKTHLFEYTSRILDSLRERKADGEFECEIHEETVFRVLTTIPDLELAIGIARDKD